MKQKVFVDRGKIKIYPPILEVVEPLMRQLGQKIHIESFRHPSFFAPQFQKARKLYVGISLNEVGNTSLEKLWEIHDSKQYSSSGMSLLDLKIEICKRLYMACRLCGHLCGINRNQQKGKCGVGTETYYDYWGELIGEETVINPSAGIALYGCTWNCAFCHALTYLSVENGNREGKLLSSVLWNEINYKNCQSIEFNAAGDPTAHLLSILQLLNTAPDSVRYPLVWSSNSHATKDVWRLLDGIFDVFLVDLKFGNDICAEKLAGCRNHNVIAEQTLESLTQISGKMIIRWLLLPGHLECCGREIVKMLSRYDFYVSLLDNFQDDYKMVFKRKNTDEEIHNAKELIKVYNFKDINNPEIARYFWKE